MRFLILATSLILAATTASARDQIRIVGSSTVYPFTTVAAEAFGKEGKFKTPIVESTGTGGGFKLFCAGVGEDHPDFVNASRAIKASEVEQCAKAGIKNPVEIKIGYDGIVVANAKSSPHANFTKEQIFKALAKQVPVNGALVPNPYKNWSDVDASLPATAIQVYGPPPTSGTRDSFVEIVMDSVCEKLPEFEKAYADKDERKKQCQALREDGAYIDSGENDNVIVQKLTSNKDAFGLFGFSFLEENMHQVQGSHVGGVAPSAATIADGSYVIARPLFVYAKQEHIGTVPGMKEFMQTLASEKMIGEDGELTMRGLIPLPKAERAKVEALVK